MSKKRQQYAYLGLSMSDDRIVPFTTKKQALDSLENGCEGYEEDEFVIVEVPIIASKRGSTKKEG